MEFKTINGGRYDYVFAGATFLSAAAATKLKEKGCRCLIFDRLIMPGHEYSFSLRQKTYDAEKSEPEITEEFSPEATELYREFDKHGAISADGSLYNPALTPVLSLMLNRASLEYYPLTIAVSIESSNGIWKISLISPGCRTEIETAHIIDTTPDFLLSCLISDKKRSDDYTLNALMEAPADYNGSGNFKFGNHEMLSTGFPGEYVARFRFYGNMHDVRMQLLDYITSKKCELKGWRVISVAEEFDILNKEDFENVRHGFVYAPSTAYPDAVSAYDAGIRLAEKLDSKSISKPVEVTKKPDISIITEPVKYDVIVAGLGTAGAIAAISAARNGLKVLGIEQLNQMGGVGTAGAIPTQYLGMKGGLYEEIDRKAAKLRENIFAGERGEGCVSKAFALEQTADKLGVDIRFGATITNVIKDNCNKNRICGICFMAEDGLHEALAEYVIDATADANVCLMTGCEMQGGRSIDGGFQLYSNISRNYNRDRGTHYSVNQDDGVVNQYNPTEFGQAVINSCITPLHLPFKYSYGSHRKLGPASWLGIREGLRIVGESTVTLPEITAGKQISEPLFYEYANLDNHGKDTAFEDRTFRDWIEICSLWDCRIAIPVPAGALIPKGYQGIIVAGRCLSVDHSIAFALRMKDAMQKCGEAAAQLIAMAKKNDCDIRDIPYKKLRKHLEADGVLGYNEKLRANYYIPSSDISHVNDLYELAEDSDKLMTILSSENGGAAIMAAAQNIKKYAPLLRKWMTTEGPVKLNCALTLCIAGQSDDYADAVIIEAISDRSGRQPANSYTFNFPYAISAMSAAGRAGLTGAIKPLLKIITDPHYADDIPNCDSFDGKTKLITDSKDIKFIYFTSALSALYSICQVHPEVRSKVSEALSELDINEYKNAISISMIGHVDSVRRNFLPLINEIIEQIINMKGNNS